MDIHSVAAEARFETSAETSSLMQSAFQTVAYAQQEKFSNILLGTLCNFISPDVMAHCCLQTMKLVNPAKVLEAESEMEMLRR